MRNANRVILAGALGFAAAVLAGCGSGGNLLSPSQANGLKSQLAQVTAALDAGQCQRAQNLIQSFQNSADSLGSVDQTLISNLDQGASTISQLAQQRCHATRTVTTPTTTNTTPTQTSTTTSTPTTTTATTPTTTTPTTTTTTPTTSTPTTTTAPSSGGTGLSGAPAGAHDNGAGNGGIPGNGGNGQ